MRHFHRRETVARRSSCVVALVAVAALVASCGSGVPGPDPIPADALPGSPADPVTLDVTALSADAIDFEGLETLLEDAGFVSGAQRLFSKTEGGRRRLLARVLVFESAEGAARYLAWLRDHVDEVIGDANADEALRAPAGGMVFAHEPDPCCHNETAVFLAAWSDGGTVLTLEIGGQAARASDVAELASTFDAAV
jgi:hypothetical protein